MAATQSPTLARTSLFSSLLASVLGALLVAGAAWAQTPVPSTTFQLRGTQFADDGVTATYRAFTNPGDPYRIICSEPCADDLNAVYGLYEGFGNAYQRVVSLFGVPPLASMQPFDIHVGDDHWCGPARTDFAGDAGQYVTYAWSGLSTGTFGCFWLTTPGRYFQPFHYPETSTLPYQELTTHELTHTEFFGRHHYSYEDFAKAVSFEISGDSGTPPVTDPCDDYLDAIGNGKLIWLLCKRNGFQWADLAPAFTALANLYASGQGTGAYGITSVYQFRHALQAQLGSGTVDAFLGSKASTPLVGDDAAFPYLGGRVPTIGAWASFLVPLGSVTATTHFHIEGPDILPIAPPGLWTFENAYIVRLANGKDLRFEEPIYLQLKYDPSFLPAGTDESTLQLYAYDGAAFQPVSISRVDPWKHTLGAQITATGTYVISASSTAVTPIAVIPRVLSTAGVRTRALLRNAASSSVSGTLQFHPQNVPASPSDPTLAYSLGSQQTLPLADVVAAFGASGAGSVDVVSTSGPLPDVLASELAPSAPEYPGSVVPVPTAAAALHGGERGFLVAPASAQEAFRLVVRTFGLGVTFDVVARDASGAVIATTSLSYPANTSRVVLPRDFAAGNPARDNESYEIDVQSGSALILGEMGTGVGAHNYRLAERADLAASTSGDALHLPQAIGQSNADGSTLRTALQLTNPGAATITGRVRFLPSDGTAAAFFNYSLPAFATRNFADVVGKVGKSGTGAVDVTSTAGNLPLALGRIIHDTAGGNQIAVEPPHDVMDVLHAGDRALLTAPPSPGANYRIGVRTLGRDLALTVQVNYANGGWAGRFTRTYPAGATVETSAASFVGQALQGGETIEINVDGGAGLVYGTGSDPTTGAPAHQGAHRLPYL